MLVNTFHDPFLELFLDCFAYAIKHYCKVAIIDLSVSA